jgi:hypothetical protein
MIGRSALGPFAGSSSKNRSAPGNKISDHDSSDDSSPSPSPTPSLALNSDVLLVQALNNLSSSLKRLLPSTKTKLREPDTFDGSNSRKLREFLLSLNLVFTDKSSAFKSDKRKIIYAVSYLKGAALDWFEPAIMGEQDPSEIHWMWNYNLFVQELEDRFGPYDFRGDAETALNDLTMKDHHRVSKYLVKFNKLAARTEWNEPALRNRFFSGLLLRLRTEIIKHGKPTSLYDLRLMAQECDQAYWMIKDKLAQELAQEEFTPIHTPEPISSVPGTPEQNSTPPSDTSTLSSPNDIFPANHDTSAPFPLTPELNSNSSTPESFDSTK